MEKKKTQKVKIKKKREDNIIALCFTSIPEYFFLVIKELNWQL